jgi:hypothetical protein
MEKKKKFDKRIAHVSYHLVRDSFPYSAPTFSGLLNHLEELSRMGYNAVCLEAESMLPFRSAPEIATGLTWTKEQAAQLSTLLKELNMEVIPLLQCLGHNYFILSHPQYTSLRELPGHFQQYCPLNPDTRKQYLAMVDDIMEFFPDVKRFHIGGDECLMLGMCPRCKAYIEKHSVPELYCQHVNQIVEAMHKRGVTSMLWSDMIEHHPETIDALHNSVQIVYWNYCMATWPRPFAVEMLHKKQLHVVGAAAIRFNQEISAICPPYNLAIKNIADLGVELNRHNVSEYMITDWPTKGTHWKMSDWGWFYAAAKSMDSGRKDTDISDEYAKYRFGLPNKGNKITEVYSLLAVFLPGCETLNVFLRSVLNRFDLAMPTWKARREKYLQADEAEKAKSQIRTAQQNAYKALAILWELKPEISRGHEQWALLEDAAREFATRADLARMALLEEDVYKDNSYGLAAELEGLCFALKARKKRLVELYSKSSNSETVTQLLKFRYPDHEQGYLSSLSKKLTGQSIANNRNDSVIPFLYNPGNPYERGMEHGRVFSDLIGQSVEWFCQAKNDSQLTPMRDVMEKYLFNKFPWMIDEMNGIAQGAGFSLETILWLNISSAVCCASKPSSDVIVAHRNNGSGVLMKTDCLEPQQRQMRILQMLDWRGKKILNCGIAGTLWTEFGLNSDGLGTCCNSASGATNQDAYGLTQQLGAYLLLTECKDFRDAVGFMREHSFTGQGLNIGCADAHGNAALFECSESVLQPSLGVAVAANVDLENKALLQPKLENFLRSCVKPTIENMQLCAALVEDECGRQTAVIIVPHERSMYISMIAPHKGHWARFKLS